MLGFAMEIAGARPRGRPDPVLRSQTRSLIARMAPAPSPTRAVQIDRLVGSLVDADIWNRLDTLLLFAAHSAQAALLNWTGQRDGAVGGGAPVFVPDRGYWCDGFDDWIDSGLTPATARLFQRNAAMVAAWTRKDARNPASPIGTVTGTSVSLNPRSSTNNSAGRLNGSALVGGGAVDTGYGFTAVDRNSSTRLRQFINGRLAGINTAAASATPSSATIGLGLANDLYAEGQFCAFVAGETLSDSQHPLLATAIATYLRDVGVTALPAVASRTLALASAFALPDGSAPIASGGGMALTGIARDLSGRWYLANGRAVRHALLFTRMTSDLSAIDREFDLTALGLSSDYAGSVQGISCDPTTGRLWLLLKSAGANGDRNYLLVFDPATGALVGTPIQVQSGDNGLAYDPARDGFWIVRDQKELVLYDRQGRPRSGAIELPADCDHVFVVDRAVGDYAVGDILVSFGGNGSTGSILRLRTGDYGGPNQVAIDILTGADAIEGVHVADDILWIANDAATHPGTPPRNRILTYRP